MLLLKKLFFKPFVKSFEQSNVQTNMKLVECVNGFVPTSVITYFSLVVKVEELVRRSDTPKQVNPMVTIYRESFADKEWLDLITSFHDPKVNMIKCSYCGLISRNLAVHIRMNHKRSRPFEFSFSGLNSQEKMFTNSEAFEASLRHKKSVWVKRSISNLMLTTYTA